MEAFYIIVQILSLMGLSCGMFMFWSFVKPPVQGKNYSFTFLSIIIPARNEALRLPSLLQSLHAQSWQHFEIIVVDDDSSEYMESLLGRLDHNSVCIYSEYTIYYRAQRYNRGRIESIVGSIYDGK